LGRALLFAWIDAAWRGNGKQEMAKETWWAQIIYAGKEKVM
jgi:hypothetical protein